MTVALPSENKWIGVLFLFYFFGTIGIAVPDLRPFFLPLTPVNLVLTTFIFFKVNQDFTKRFLVLSAIIFLIGYTVEAVGVNTGVLFGNYWYGTCFGFKIFKTPVLIGANWLFLSFATHGVVQYLTKNRFLLVCIPALMMTVLDYFIEPVAMKLGFWHWADDTVPVQNYIMWLLVGLVIHSLISYFNPKINTKVSFAIVLVQFAFFITLFIFCT